MARPPLKRLAGILLAALYVLGHVAYVLAQEPSNRLAGRPALRDYVVGPHDVLSITSYDDPALSGTFAVEADRTFTYPLIGRVRAGGLTLREVESELEGQLTKKGFFRKPDITVAVEEYKSHKVFILGEVRNPGAYTLSGGIRLVEALALAGSTLPSASGEAVIVPAGIEATVADSVSRSNAASADTQKVARVNLHKLHTGEFSQNVALSDGDTVFVLRAENVYVFGHVRNPGAYPLQQQHSTVLQALTLAGGVTDRGSMSRIEVVRIVDGEREKLKVKLTDILRPGDTIMVPERFF